MRMVTKKPIASKIKLASSKHNIYARRILKSFPFIVFGHFVFASYALNQVIPLLPIFVNPQNIINVILGLCLISYPVLFYGALKRAKLNFNSDQAVARSDLILVSEDMDIMGLDVSLQNLLDASVELTEHKEKFNGIHQYRIDEEAIIKIRNRKSKLLILRECTTLIEEYAYKEPFADSIVHLLEDEEYSHYINRRQLNKR